MEPVPATATAIEFGRFRVLPYRRELLAEGQPLDLRGGAFDVLMALIEASRCPYFVKCTIPNPII
jgi:DNA-binding response OmpR family regulator